MGMMQATADDYSEVLHALRPVGPAMVVDDPVLQGLAVEFSRVHNRLGDLVRESDPRTTYELLTDWERAAGLPDECCGTSADLTTRLNALVARIRGAATPTAQYFIDLAAAVGYDITITELEPFTVSSDVGYPLYSEEIRFVWQVNAGLTTVTYSDVNSTVSTPLATWGNSILECVMNRAKAAHTHVIYSYTSGFNPATDNVISHMVTPLGYVAAKAMDAAISELHAKGYLPRFDRLGVFRGLPEEQQRLLDWKDPTKSITLSGAATSTKADGFVGSAAAAAHGSTGFIPSVDGDNYTLNDCSVFVYVGAGATSAVTGNYIGANSGVSADIWRSDTGNNVGGMSNNASYTRADSTARPSNALLCLNRTGAGAVKIYSDGVDISNFGEAAASSSLPTVEFWLGCMNGIGSEYYRTDAPIKAWGCGGSFTAAEQADIKSIFDTYFAALP